MSDPRLPAIVLLGALTRDRALADLAAVARRREGILAALAQLSVPPHVPGWMDPVTAARTAYGHTRWTGHRRAALQRELAAATAHWLEARAAAAKATGRWAALDALARRGSRQ